jgi:Outer membrane protein beta-barrel domain
MKKPVLLIAILLTQFSIYSQTSSVTEQTDLKERVLITMGFGTARLINLPKEIYYSYSMVGQLGLNFDFPISSQKWFFTTGAFVKIERHFTDGIIEVDPSNDKNDFLLSPDNYKVNRLDFINLGIPLQFKFIIDDKGGFFRGGINLEYLLSSKNNYRITQTNFNDKIDVTNKFRIDAEMLFGMTRKKVNDGFFNHFAGGIYYQLNSLTNTENKFNTLGIMLYIGI